MKNQRERLIFSERDEYLFRYLHAHKVARFDQIQRDVYPGYNEKTLYWRLKKLERNGFLQSRYGANQGNRKMFSISRKGFDSFLKRGDERRREFTSDAIDHDLMLLDTRRILERSPRVLSFLTENQLQTWNEYEDNKDTAPFVELRTDAA